jgi:hypothetical protein
MIEYLLSPRPSGDLDDQLASLAAAPGLMPFDERLLGFVAGLSRAVLADRAFREYPELMAMAHWFRAASLPALRAALPEQGHALSVRRGIVFHIAPSNVDSVFIYSWLLSLLCGNANIARVSRRRSPQMQAFFATAARLLEAPEHRSLAAMNLVLSYDHEDALTARLSACCHMRVVWGGDQTVARIRAIALPPLATELAFANRFSLAVVKSDAVLALDSEGLTTLAKGFYNDAFWFNQQACSSPRAIVWIGDAGKGQAARERFWAAMAETIAQRRPENLPAQMMDRVTTLYRLALEHPGACTQTAIGALPTRILVPSLEDTDRACHDGNGLFLELDRDALEAVPSLLTSRDQTIAHFGFTRGEWLGVLPNLPPHAADRIVPLGQALAFSPVWDGTNLLVAYTRKVVIEGA